MRVREREAKMMNSANNKVANQGKQSQELIQSIFFAGIGREEEGEKIGKGRNGSKN